VNSVGVFDNEFAAIIVFWFGKKQSGGNVGANAVTGAGDLPESVVNVSAERLAALIAIEKRWENAQGKRRGDGHFP
jgi:hypothetical protein